MHPVMRHERGGNRTGVQAVLHKTREQVQGMTGILPESGPDAIGNCVGKLRPVAQIADRRPWSAQGLQQALHQFLTRSDG
jgi:hypothetical protein